MRRTAATLIAALVLAACSSNDQQPQPTPTETPALVDEFDEPLVIAHRGGPDVYPEHSMPGYTAAAAAGYAPEPDIQFLADDTPVALHDPTVDRTMTGATGPDAELTLEEWEAARIRPAKPDGDDAAPVTLEQILDDIGGAALLVPEVKPDATPEQVDIVIDMVTERDLHGSVLMQSFTYDSVLQMIDADLETMYLTGPDLPDEPFEQMRADGITWIGTSRTMDPADVQQLSDAGFRVVAYTIKTTDELEELDDAYSGFFSDNPWAHDQEALTDAT